MRDSAPRHITLPSRVASLSGCFAEAGPSTPQPMTPLPYMSVDPSQGGSDIHGDAVHLEESQLGDKRGRAEADAEESPWSDEEIEVVQASLQHPFRPFSSAFPPGELPPPNILDELTNQILSFALRGSPGSQSEGSGWTHGWDATRKKVYSVALESSRIAHGIEKEKIPRSERTNRPGLRRMDSMDFLDEAAGTENVGAAIRLSTSLQKSAQAAPSISNDSNSNSSSSSSTTSSNNPSNLNPSHQVIRKKPSPRNSLNRQSRPASLLQRGRSYTATELQAESTPSPKSPVSHSESTGPLQRPVRITRSQSTIIASKPSPHAARDYFLHNLKSTSSSSSPSSQPQTLLHAPATLDVCTSPSSWSDSEDEEIKAAKKTRAQTKKLPNRSRAVQKSLDGSLQSPFEEKNSFI